jgi:hypothetical protein
MIRKTFEIEIRRAGKNADAYVASYHSPVLGATYTVKFPATVTGAVALHHFTEMLKSRYPAGGTTRFILPASETLQPVIRDALEMEHAGAK